jgi:hypothetical protein
MDYDSFKVVCFTNDIDPELIEACREFVTGRQHTHIFERPRLDRANSDLGYAELADINSTAKGIKEIKEAIWMATTDYDSKGRSLEKKLMKKLIVDPGKHMKRIVLKTYFLFEGK